MKMRLMLCGLLVLGLAYVSHAKAMIGGDTIPRDDTKRRNRGFVGNDGPPQNGPPRQFSPKTIALSAINSGNLNTIQELAPDAVEVDLFADKAAMDSNIQPRGMEAVPYNHPKIPQKGGGKGDGKGDGKGKKPGPPKKAQDGDITININNGFSGAGIIAGGKHMTQHIGNILGQAACPTGFDSLLHGCYLLSDMETSRADAMRYCRALNSDLVALDGPACTYRAKFLIQNKSLAEYDFWTSGIEIGDEWFWETSGNEINYNFFQTPQDISMGEKAMWRPVVGKKKPSKEEGMMGYLSREQLTPEHQCLLLGQDAEQGMDLVWKSSPCLDTKARFICKMRPNKPRPTKRPKPESEEDELLEMIDESAENEDDDSVETYDDIEYEDESEYFGGYF